MRNLLSVIAVCFFALPLVAKAEVRLLMAEEEGCLWCARWDAEISDAYPKTSEGRAAPLLKFDMHSEPPEGIVLTAPVRFSPTFILVNEGVEIDRLEGYPGEDFFWGLLARMLDRAGIELEEVG